jgi:hypothetical protein
MAKRAREDKQCCGGEERRNRGSMKNVLNEEIEGI